MAGKRKYLASLTGFSLESTRDLINMVEINDYTQNWSLLENKLDKKKEYADGTRDSFNGRPKVISSKLAG